MFDVIQEKLKQTKVSVFSPSFDYGRTGLDAINSLSQLRTPQYSCRCGGAPWVVEWFEWPWGSLEGAMIRTLRSICDMWTWNHFVSWLSEIVTFYMYNFCHLHVYVCMFVPRSFLIARCFRSHNFWTRRMHSSMILVDISQRIDAAKCMGICVLTADFVETSLVLGVV